MLNTYKKQSTFGDSLVQGMQESLNQFPDKVAPPVVKTASVKGDSFQELAASVAEVAEKLAALGHPMAKQADIVLNSFAKVGKSS